MIRLHVYKIQVIPAGTPYVSIVIVSELVYCGGQLHKLTNVAVDS